LQLLLAALAQPLAKAREARVHQHAASRST
jgi:hypothetical protein